MLDLRREEGMAEKFELAENPTKPGLKT